MSQFFKFMFASCLGVILAIVALTGFSTLFFTFMATQLEKPVKVGSNAVLRLTLDEYMPELTNNVEAQPFSLDPNDSKVIGLHEFIATLENAKADKNIKGIFLEVDFLPNGAFTSSRAIREAIRDFRESGKFVVAHSNIYTQGAYYIASAADEVYASPLGIMDIRGFAAQVPFFKDAVDRLGVNMQIFYAGKFKSATEPWRRTEMSPENKLQTREYLEENYDIFLADISADRKMEKKGLRRVVNQSLADSPEGALENNLIDGVDYREAVLNKLRDRLGLDEDDSINFISLANYNKANPPQVNYKVKDKIAVVYAEGAIVNGKGANGQVGDLRYNKIFQELEEDNRVKAVVLRINSGGGSALASEEMWYNLGKIKESGKPLVVSMGDYAASGGYYIACLGDSIFARPSTLTGSIGVFSVIPSFEEGMERHLGIAFDSVKTGPFATGLTLNFDLTPEQKQRLQIQTEQTYEQFLKRVAEGRNMSRDAVDAIGQGRVWTGQQALEIGLVDQLGDLDEAIATAARMAGLETYRTTNYPKVKDPFQQLIDELSGQTDDMARVDKMVRKQFPEYYQLYEQLKLLKEARGVQARMPFVVEFN